MREALGTYLMGQRHEQGLTLRDVADLADCSLGYVSEVERGVKETSSELIAALLGSLGLQWSEMFTSLAQQAVAYEQLSDLSSSVSNINQGSSL